MFRQHKIQQQLTELLEVQRLALRAKTHVVSADVALHLDLVVEEKCLEVGRSGLALLKWGVVFVPGVFEKPDVGSDVVHQLGGEVGDPVHHVDPLC